MRYIVDWNPDLEGDPHAVDSEEASDLNDAKSKAAAKSKRFGMAYAVAINAAGETVGAIGYAGGRIDTKEGVLA